MFTIVGIKPVTRKSDGVRFVELHALSDDRFVNGQRCDTFFVREDMIDNVGSLTVGSISEVIFNRYGRVDRVVIH